MKAISLFTSRRGTLLFLIALTALLTWLAWNTNAPRMGHVLTNASDPLGYYQWLPWTFLHGDWSAFPYVHYLPEGKGLGLFTMGVALLQTPFFLLAWLYCAIVGIEATGFELPFVFARLLATSVYTAGGIVLLLKTLVARYTVTTSLLTAGAIMFGTTLYFYTVHDGGMSHAYSFFLITWVMYLTHRMLEGPRWDRLLGLMFCMSVIILIRPLNGVVIFYVLLAGSHWRIAIPERIAWLKDHLATTLLGTLLALLVWLPQLTYWKMQSGSWFIFTYGKKDESFDFSDPHLFDTLFNLQNGWFIYTPLMLFAFGTLLWQAWKGVGAMRVTLLIWTFVWYVYASWWCWWLGNAFGYRGFIELYGLMAFPLAALFDRLLQHKYFRLISIALLVVLVRTNIRLGDMYYSPWEGPEWTWAKLGDFYVRALLW